MDSSTDYFTIFDLPVGFDIDNALLKARYLSLQKKLHPDRVARQSALQQRLALQSTALINQAFSVLSSSVQRAGYLLERAGLETTAEQTHTDVEFLTTQMELRECLAELEHNDQPLQALSKLEAQVVGEFRALEEAFAAAYAKGELETARAVRDKMQFFDKLRIEIEQLEESLED